MLAHPLEIAAAKKGMGVVGIDEVGRGALAGPLVVGVCLLEYSFFHQKAQDAPTWVESVRDSKKISKNYHHQLAENIKGVCQYWFFTASPYQIDKEGVGHANKRLIDEAITTILSTRSKDSCHFLIDYVTPDQSDVSYSSFPKADSTCFSVACAAILAKNYRDSLMKGYSEKFPYYSWETNAGYGTKAHVQAIARHGITSFHRKSFLKGY